MANKSRNFISILLTFLFIIERFHPILSISSLGKFPLKSQGSGKLTIPLSITDLKPSICRMKEFRQKIRHRGCTPVFVANNMCYGQCLSIFIPKRRIDFKSCSYCTPVEKRIQKVTLRCPGQRPRKRVKKIKIITRCQCRICGHDYI